MRLSIPFSLLLSVSCVHGFIAPRVVVVAPSSYSNTLTQVAAAPSAEATAEPEATAISAQKKATLGLITFDLDDTLYPIAPVIEEANAAFANAMAKFGYEGIAPQDINLTGKIIRSEIAETDPEAAAILTHTEIREMAIRCEMETIMLKRKLQETADAWATPVSSLADVVVAYAKK